MTEWATYEWLESATKTAYEYGGRSVESQKVKKAFKQGRRLVYHRVNTPAPEKYPVLYIFARVPMGVYFRTFLVLEGSEGDSFAGQIADEKMFHVIHSHAINRYIERRKFQGTLEEAQRTILNGLFVNDVQQDETDETRYIYFDGGLFLCTLTDGVLHLRTFIMNCQCSPVQRMKSLTSEKNTQQLKKEYGITQ